LDTYAKDGGPDVPRDNPGAHEARLDEGISSPRSHQAGQFDLRAFVRPIAAVPESKGIDEVLDELRTAKDKIAIVLDEYGGTAGLVTLPDLVEPLVGRIRDDQAASSTERVGAVDAAYAFDGMTRLSEWEEGTRTSLSADDREAADTLGGLVMARLGRIPELGDAVEIGGHVVTVESLDGRRVDRVHVRRKGMLPPSPSAGS
jgi:CBS domain containing-hemolysin-like protein